MSKSILIFSIIIILLMIGMGIRLIGLDKIDLYTDEAMATEISKSLIKYGELNNFRYSKFFFPSHFRRNMFIYYPPLYYFMQAPVMLLGESWSPNLLPRLTPLLLNCLLIIMLYFISCDLFKSRLVGLIAIIFTIFNGYHIAMSRTVLPYAVLPAFLCIAFWFLARALNKRAARYWAGFSVFLILAFYAHQMAILFGFVCLAGVIVCFKDNKTEDAWYLSISSIAALIVCSIWPLFFLRSAALRNSFFEMFPNYSFVGQISMILKHYNNMLPDFLLKAMFFIGGIKILYEVIRQKRHISILLVVWALIPFTFIATRSMWIHKYHLFFVYPPVIIIAAYGSYVFIRYVIDKLCGQFLSIKWRAYIVIFLFSFAISIPQLKNINLYADAVTGEFGSPGIASRACDYIKQHYAGEVIIAPIGLAESYYLEKFVYDKAKVDAVERCFKLISDNSAWVFMGDNFFNNGKLDEFDRYVQENGKLIMRSNPVSGFTDKGNKAGYALYYIEKQPAFKNMHKYSIDY